MKKRWSFGFKKTPEFISPFLQPLFSLWIMLLFSINVWEIERWFCGKSNYFFTIWKLAHNLFAWMQCWGSSHVTALLTPALWECISLVAQIAISILFLDSACNCTALLFDSVSVPLISELFSSVYCFQHTSLNCLKPSASVILNILKVGLDLGGLLQPWWLCGPSVEDKREPCKAKELAMVLCWWSLLACEHKNLNVPWSSICLSFSATV